MLDSLTPSLAPFSYLCATSFSPPTPSLPPVSLTRPVVKYARSGHKARQIPPPLPSPHSLSPRPTLCNPTGSNLSVNSTALTQPPPPFPLSPFPPNLFPSSPLLRTLSGRLSQWIPGFLV